MLHYDEIQNNTKRISDSHRAFQAKIDQHPKVKSTRSIGVILAIDLNTTANRYGDLRDKLLSFFMENGVFLRPLGNTIYIQPAYVMSDEELKKVYQVIENSLIIF